MGYRETIDLLEQLSLAKKEVEVGSFYVHYRAKDKKYKVIGLGLLEASEEPAVIYEREGVVWIRAISSWLDKVECEGEMVSRFQKVL
jgi:hypothetical protein